MEQFDAIIRLKNHKDFGLFRRYLLEAQLEVMRRSTTTPTEPLRSWLQGQSQVLNDVEEYIDKSNEFYEKMRQQKIQEG
jgi:hypothetical protein